MSCEGFFIEQLRLRGYRLTPQREIVLRVLHEVGRAATAEEIFARVAEESASVELSTVYRTLDLLSELGMISTIEAGDRQRLYELAGHRAPHFHLVCRSCGTIISVDLDYLQPLFAHLNTIQFSPDRGNITIAGLCGACEAQAAG